MHLEQPLKERGGTHELNNVNEAMGMHGSLVMSRAYGRKHLRLR